MMSYLQEERKHLGLRQDDVYPNIGVGKATYVRWESGSPIPSDKLALLAKSGFDIQFIVTGTRSINGDFDAAALKQAIDIVAGYIHLSGGEIIHPEMVYTISMELYELITNLKSSGEDVSQTDLVNKVVSLFAA